MDLKATTFPSKRSSTTTSSATRSAATAFRDAESVRVYAIGPEDSPARALARHIRKTAPSTCRRIASA
jgi:hypothetical protein